MCACVVRVYVSWLRVRARACVCALVFVLVVAHACVVVLLRALVRGNALAYDGMLAQMVQTCLQVLRVCVLCLTLCAFSCMVRVRTVEIAIV